MNNDEILLGSHIGLSSPNYYLDTCKTAVEWGENVFMFYTGAPQNTRRVDLDKMKISEGRAYLKEQGIDEKNIIVHAPYIINLGNAINESTYELARDFLIKEIERVQAFGLNKLVLHPGSHVGAGSDKGSDMIISGLNYVFEKTESSDVIVCLETMAGKGSEVGRTFEELAHIIVNIKPEYQDRIGVCLDTCHISDGDYDVNDVDGILDEFDKVIGLDKLKCIHLNDSKNPRGAHKDRHENIGYGEIGFETLEKWVKNPRLISIPKVLETPWAKEGDITIPPYSKEIQMLKSGVYEDGWREKLLEEATK